MEVLVEREGERVGGGCVLMQTWSVLPGGIAQHCFLQFKKSTGECAGIRLILTRCNLECNIEALFLRSTSLRALGSPVLILSLVVLGKLINTWKKICLAPLVPRASSVQENLLLYRELKDI